MVEQRRETSAAHRSGETVETKLLRIAAKARKEREFKFTSLYHLMSEEQLLECFRRLDGNKAAGIDEVAQAANVCRNLRTARTPIQPKPSITSIRCMTGSLASST
jgi:hypothetical protein